MVPGRFRYPNNKLCHSSATSMRLPVPQRGPSMLERWGSCLFDANYCRRALLSSVLAASVAWGSHPLAAPARVIDLTTTVGALQQQEQTVETLFQRATPSVVFITTFVEKTDRVTMNAIEVPAGTGSGFVWDDNGHIGARPPSHARVQPAFDPKRGLHTMTNHGCMHLDFYSQSPTIM